MKLRIGRGYPYEMMYLTPEQVVHSGVPALHVHAQQLQHVQHPGFQQPQRWLGAVPVLLSGGSKDGTIFLPAQKSTG